MAGQALVDNLLVGNGEVTRHGVAAGGRIVCIYPGGGGDFTVQPVVALIQDIGLGALEALNGRLGCGQLIVTGNMFMMAEVQPELSRPGGGQESLLRLG